MNKRKQILIRYVFKEIARVGVDWIHLVQDSDKWLALTKAVINLYFPYNVVNFFD
jgi:hypothetical protein